MDFDACLFCKNKLTPLTTDLRWFHCHICPKIQDIAAYTSCLPNPNDPTIFEALKLRFQNDLELWISDTGYDHQRYIIEVSEIISAYSYTVLYRVGIDDYNTVFDFTNMSQVKQTVETYALFA